MKFVLHNNSTLSIVINAPIPYSKRWKERLQEETQNSLDSYDAVVLGLMNECGLENAFATEMKALSEQLPDVDCLHIPPPTLTKWTQVYHGPIIFLPMMSPKDELVKPILKDMENILEKQTQFQHLSYLPARQHIEAMGIECASNSRTGTSDCTNDMGPITGPNRHRCEGASGGHPNLVAWDLIERLYEIMD
eukprot:scaffold37622_cov199-Amphora_coffeaeformis.AAC.2